MACDICGENRTTLVPLRELFQTEEVKQVCPACESDVSKQDWKLKKITDKIRSNWMKRYILNRKHRQRQGHLDL